MTLTPAYGRDYKSMKEVKSDFEAGKDFIIADVMDRYHGKPVNKEQLQAAGVTQVTVRYKNLRAVAFFKVGG
jgi:hypothetical protein